tara:strand:+ start:513 stop:1070 length:558 start_codon:yes stop_codon:yes gene_type:complete
MSERKKGIGMLNKSNDDEYYTPESAIKMLEPYIQKFKNKVCWECFGENFELIESPLYLKRMGFTVVANGKNFWECDQGDFVISNPPYSDFVNGEKVKRGMGKYSIMKRLCDLNKPFCLLMPTTFMQTKCFKKLVDEYGKFQIIMPSVKIQFYKIINGKKVVPGKCNLYTCWFCWNMNFTHDFIMV